MPTLTPTVNTTLLCRQHPVKLTHLSIRKVQPPFVDGVINHSVQGPVQLGHLHVQGSLLGLRGCCGQQSAMHAFNPMRSTQNALVSPSQ